jgi:hypothetical protein
MNDGGRYIGPDGQKLHGSGREIASPREPALRDPPTVSEDGIFFFKRGGGMYAHILTAGVTMDVFVLAENGAHRALDHFYGKPHDRELCAVCKAVGK